MKRLFSLFIAIVLFFPSLKAENTLPVQEVKPVKNTILLIADGCSFSTISLARWYQRYLNPEMIKLNIDPYLSGTVLTYSSNAPIGDSAPTTSCYMTGMPSITGFVATYPWDAGNNNLIPVDSTMAYRPLMTVLEAAKITQNRSTGLVFTCEFPHATPADCSAHSYKRSRYEWIAPQMVHNNIDVVIGGGTSLLTSNDSLYLAERGYSVYKDNMHAMRQCDNNKMWALYHERSMPYEIDRNPETTPSLEEMTRTALEKLSQNPNGFFLMVEGSKVDWAAHANDPIAMITDFLAFDKACGAAFEFARKNGETAIIVLADHGNSGISIGTERCKGYDKLSADQLFEPLTKMKKSAFEISNLLNLHPASEASNLFEKYAGFPLNEEELEALYHCKDYKQSPIKKEERTNNEKSALYSGSLTTFVSQLMNLHTCIGFTTHGHTGEEVFLASYHSKNTPARGMMTNIEINEYLCKLFGLENQLPELTQKYFADHTNVFEGLNYQIIQPKDKKFPELIIKNKRRKMIVHPFSNLVTIGKETMELNSVVVYVDKLNKFFLPESLREELLKK